MTVSDAASRMDRAKKYTEPRIAKGSGADIVFDSFGEPKDPAVLLIMGLGDQMITWHEDLCALIAAQGFFVIRFDNRDIGLSTKFSSFGVPNVIKITLQKMLGLPARVPYTLSEMAADAKSVLDAANVRSACVVGASMGGMIAQVMAVEHPERVSTLVSVISSGELVPGATMLFRFASSSFRNMLAGKNRLPFSPSLKALSFLLQDPPDDREGYATYYANLEQTLIGPGFVAESERTREFARTLYDRGISVDGTMRQLAGILASASRIERLKKLAVPTLVVHGDSDPLIPVWLGIQTAKLIPGAQLKIFPGLGHWLPPIMWPEFADLLAGFIRTGA